jgi:peptide/nickel transport system substrate-binding protein
MSPRRVPQWPLLAALALGVVAIAALWFVIPNPLNSSDENSDGQRYVEAIVGSPARVNPLFAPLNDTDSDLVALVFSGLTRLGPQGEVLPDLAEDFEISEDGLTYTFNLRSDAKWHTGAPFTAEDALFTFELLADPELPSDPTLGQLWRQVSCSAPDQFTLLCELPEPFAPFLSHTTIGLLPKHILESTTAATLAEDRFNQEGAVGTGPYRLAQLDQTKAILKANPAYYGQRPAIDEIEVRFYPDTSTAAAALARGEVQGLLLGPSANQEDFDLLTSSPGLRAATANRTAYAVLFLNNLQPPFNDKALRQAVSLSVNVDNIIGELLGGRAVRADSPMVPGTWAYNPELEPRPHDPEEARKLLDEAGWTTTDGAIRQKEGNELRISLMTDQDPLRIAIAQDIANQLAEVGIQVAVAPQGSADLVGEFLVPHQYQAAIFGWDPGPDPDPYPAWHSSQVGPEGRNLAGYQNADTDRIIEDARRTSDLDKRQALYYTFQQKFHEDIPSVLLYYPVFTYFIAEELQDAELGTLFQTSSRFASATQWTVGESDQLLGD